MKVLLVFPPDDPPSERAQDALALAIVEWAYREGVQVSVNAFTTNPKGQEEGTSLADVYPFHPRPTQERFGHEALEVAKRYLGPPPIRAVDP